MATQDAKRDSNRIPTLVGVDNVTFTDSTTVGVDPATHELLTTSSVSSLPTVTATASLTAQDQAATIALAGAANTTWQLAGTWDGVVSFEASNDNSNWVAIWAYQVGSGTIIQATTVNGIFRNTTAGFAYVRARFSTRNSGTVVVTGVASHGTSGIFNNFPQYGPQQIGKQEDVAFAGGDTGVPAMAIQKATPADTASDGDYVMAQMSGGRLWTSSKVTNGLILPTFDYVSMTIAPAGTETYVFKTGGAGGTTVSTVVIVYTDATRVDISTVTQT